MRREKNQERKRQNEEEQRRGKNGGKRDEEGGERRGEEANEKKKEEMEKTEEEKITHCKGLTQQRPANAIKNVQRYNIVLTLFWYHGAGGIIFCVLFLSTITPNFS